MTARLSSEDHSLAIWLPMKLHIFIFTNGGEVNSPWWVIQIVAAPVPLHSSLYCFPQAKVSGYIWFVWLHCRIYRHESPEGLWLPPGSMDSGSCYFRNLCTSFLLLLEDRLGWRFSARGRSGRGQFTPLACGSPYLRYVLSHGKGNGLWWGLHPDIYNTQVLSGEKPRLLSMPVIVLK